MRCIHTKEREGRGISMVDKYEKLKHNTILCFDIASTQFTEELQEDIDDCCAEILKCFDELAAYKAIGTIEKFNTLKEKNTPKKPLKDYCWHCPNCEEETYWDTECGQQKFRYCHNCGQKIDWQ